MDYSRESYDYSVGGPLIGIVIIAALVPLKDIGSVSIQRFSQVFQQYPLALCGAAKGTRRNCAGSSNGSFLEQDFPTASSAGLTTMAGCGLYGGRA